MVQWTGSGLAHWSGTEQRAIEDSSRPAGAYIESLGRTDIATWTADEWMGLLKTVIGGYYASLRAIPPDEVPF